jgi:predicted acyl esterase
MRLTVTPCLLTLLALLAGVVPAAGAATPRPFGQLDCAAREGVRFCEGRVATFDGVPLDLNVTLPASGEGDFPLVVLSHGWGGAKYPLVDAGDRANVSGSSLPWAQRGYAVLSITARGFNGSCGRPDSRVAAGCERGWIKLDDTRYEIRDVQHLVGRLVDDGLVDPVRVGVHGGSYGGGVSNALALLRNRIMRPDGTYAPWVSPKGRRVQLAAAAPYIPWSDLVYSLTPNGRTLDYVMPRPDDSRKPAGVMKQSFVSGLYALGSTTGTYAPPGADAGADLTRWFAQIGAGEPYDGNAAIAQIADEIYAHHSSIAIDRGVEPAPILIANGWTDDLFPVDEALRLRNAIAARWPDTPFAMMHFDFGHQRGTGKKADVARYREHVVDWMDRWVKGDRRTSVLTGVETLTQTCPATAPSGGPFRAGSWPELRRGEVRHDVASAGTVTSAGGDPGIAQAIDPIAGGGDACAQVDAADESGTVNVRLPAAGGEGYTLMGAPTVVADLAVTGEFAQLAARLWDVAPDGRQTLVARGVYRPDPSGRQVFQLHPNGWRFAPGHAPKLQLLGRDAPYARASNGAFSIEVANLQLRLPVVDRPGAGSAVREPLPYVLPAGATLAPGFAGSRSGSGPARRRAKRRLYLVTGCKGVRLRGPDVRKVRRMTVFRARMKRRIDRRIPFRVGVRGGRGRAVRARVVLRGGRVVSLRARLPARCAAARSTRR